MSVRTRFAPSPTGFLHIGGVRTALFNWLLARHHGGQFILRIDDTDQQRHVEDAVRLILDGFRWMGMDWDEGPEAEGPHAPYFQSQRGDKYKVAADALVATGHVYRDYSTEVERAEAKSAAERSKIAFRYRGVPPTPEQIAQHDSEGRTYALRFQVPLGRTLVLDDLIKGPVEQRTDEVGDFVIVRPDGSPLYNFATVVDDADMQITHVVRAEEHLANTFPQLLVFEALGYPLPPVRARPLRGRAGVEEEALEARRRGGVAGVRDARLPARGDDELPRAAGLEPRRQHRDLLARRPDREVHARPREQLPREPRPRQALLDPERVDEDADDRAKGRRSHAVPGARGSGGKRPRPTRWRRWSRPWGTGSRRSRTS